MQSRIYFIYNILYTHSIINLFCQIKTKEDTNNLNQLENYFEKK